MQCLHYEPVKELMSSYTGDGTNNHPCDFNNKEVVRSDMHARCVRLNLITVTRDIDVETLLPATQSFIIGPFCGPITKEENINEPHF